MATRRKKTEEPPCSEDGDSDTRSEESKRAKKEGDSSHYEHMREQRIKENKERMQKLGLFDLSLNLKPPKKDPPEKKTKNTNHSPRRRSSRIMSLEPVNYSEKGAIKGQYKKENKENKEKDNLEIVIPEGTNPEVYTEEQEKLLGDCETTWELNVDGYDEDGDRIYDSIKGEICHQCRQKTVGEHTSCNKCELPQGQFCGDCLYTRYGENVIEANGNSKWTCPPCRDICNCMRCRREKGWRPTGNIYQKVFKLGFKSVAHYLIKTRRAEESDVGEVAEEMSENSAEATRNRRTRTRRSLDFIG
ncbi:hypothetical protein RJT34_04546 [Clitoria ternatea]|uniref:Zinc-finger domain-containing protein n=1 Tax=Clitoria ternatea TaxID=43366 RepID=A0AAN9Q696_CLITE